MYTHTHTCMHTYMYDKIRSREPQRSEAQKLLRHMRGGKLDPQLHEGLVTCNTQLAIANQ